MITQAVSGIPDTLPRIDVERRARMASGALTSQSLVTQAFHTRSAGKRTLAMQAGPWGRRRTRANWLAGVLKELNGIDQEADEEGYPPIEDAAKRNAERLLWITNTSQIEPRVYPSMDGEIALYFKSPSASAALLILLDNAGGAGCYWSLGGRSERKRFDDASNLPGEFVWAHLRSLGGSSVSQTVE